MASPQHPLPDFDNPPVIETALSVEFAALAQWGIPHFGLFWQEIRPDYPHFEVQPPLPSQIERFADEARQPVTMKRELIAPPPVRCRFFDESQTRPPPSHGPPIRPAPWCSAIPAPQTAEAVMGLKNGQGRGSVATILPERGEPAIPSARRLAAGALTTQPSGGGDQPPMLPPAARTLDSGAPARCNTPIA